MSKNKGHFQHFFKCPTRIIPETGEGVGETWHLVFYLPTLKLQQGKHPPTSRRAGLWRGKSAFSPCYGALPKNDGQWTLWGKMGRFVKRANDNGNEFLNLGYV